MTGSARRPGRHVVDELCNVCLFVRAREREKEYRIYSDLGLAPANAHVKEKRSVSSKKG